MKQHSRFLQHSGKVIILFRSLICSGSEPFIPEEHLLSAEGEIFLDTNLVTPLVDQVINSVSSIIDPTLPSESEVVESMSFLPDPVLLSENVPIEVITVIYSFSPPTLPDESGDQTVDVFMLRSYCS